MFGRSATVGDEDLICRQILEIAGLKFVQWDVERAFDVRHFVCFGASHVDDDRLAFRDQLLGVFHFDARHFVFGVLRGVGRRNRRRRITGRVRAGRRSGRARFYAARRRNRQADGQRARAQFQDYIHRFTHFGF